MVRRSNPDRILVARLTGISGRHASKGTPEAEAVAELQEVAGGRADLLAEVAGTALAAAEQSLYPGWNQRAAALCIAAGADESLIPAQIEIVRDRLKAPQPTSHD